MNANIEDLYSLTLADGVPVQREGQTIRYRQVRLRETTIADERAALRLAERVVMVGGQPKLMCSDADFRYALTLRHIEQLRCDELVIDGALIDMDLFGKLCSHDLGLIEARVFLITMAAEVRYGNLSQEDFDAYMSGMKPLPAGSAAPQPVGQAAELGPIGPEPVPGPALLADYAGGAAGGAGAGDGH